MHTGARILHARVMYLYRISAYTHTCTQTHTSKHIQTHTHAHTYVATTPTLQSLY